MLPPHLPPKSCNIENHHRWRRLKILLVAVAFGLIAGMSGASIMLGWIWPRFADSEAWITSYTRPGLSRAQLENHVRAEISTRIAAVYKGSVAAGGVSYLNKKIGDGIMVSSDGWLAMYAPNYDGVYKNMQVVTGDGRVAQPESALFDKHSGIVFIKIKDRQFKVVSFTDTVLASDDLFVFQDSYWYHGFILYPFLSGQIPRFDLAPRQFYSLSGSFGAGKVAINNQGRVAGFITEKNLLLPSFYVARILPKILSQQMVSYPSLGTDGWFSDEQPIVVGKEKVSGFYVASVWSPASVLRRGDVLLTVNGRVVAPDNLWYIISDSQSVDAAVLRGGKQINLKVKIIQTK